jgi:diguanylate cyclase (GGDEF)-like protein/putative nucleotidyltransferase with HDIG domain
MLNVTNFGMFNDTYGYAEGDSVLRNIAGTLNEFSADVSSIGRVGGDVFMVLLSARPKEQSLELVRRIDERCRRLAYHGRGQTIPVSLASGYAFAPLDASTRSELLALCEHRARLSRKQGGRPVGEDDIDAYQLHGVFRGIETIVDSLLDRDPFTRVHLVHVNSMAKRWAEFNLELERGDLETILQASLLHDVGKLLISDRILVKPSSLSAEEYRAIQYHAEFGKNILSRYEAFAEVAEIVGQHHERWDGFGYPAGLQGEQIHPLARAISILDAFSAMVMDRPYHRGIAEDCALAEIERCSGSQFDPYYVDRFIEYRRKG